MVSIGFIMVLIGFIMVVISFIMVLIGFIMVLRLFATPRGQNPRVIGEMRENHKGGTGDSWDSF